MKLEGSSFLGIRVSALVEIACFFIILTLIGFISGETNLYSVSPHPYWILIIFISAQYGTLAGLLSAIIATILYFSGPLPFQNITQEWHAYFFSLGKLPMLWIVTAFLLGELRMKHIRERDRLKDIANKARERESKLAESYQALKKIKERLEMRIASETQTTLMVITAFKELENQGKEGAIKGASELTKILVAPEKFSIYLLNPTNELKKVFTNGWNHAEKYSETFDPNSLLYQEIISKKKVISILSADSEVLGSEGVLAAPLVNPTSKHVVGMIKIEQIPFQRLTTSTIESLSKIGEWVGKAYEQ